MANRQDGMPPNHARAGVAHDRLDAPTHFGVVAMHRAFVADRLPIPERALGDPFLRIRQKPGTIFAQILCRTVVGAAEDANHDGDGSGFEIHRPFLPEHPTYSKIEAA